MFGVLTSKALPLQRARACVVLLLLLLLQALLLLLLRALLLLAGSPRAASSSCDTASGSAAAAAAACTSRRTAVSVARHGCPTGVASSRSWRPHVYVRYRWCRGALVCALGVHHAHRAVDRVHLGGEAAQRPIAVAQPLDDLAQRGSGFRLGPVYGQRQSLQRGRKVVGGAVVGRPAAARGASSLPSASLPSAPAHSAGKRRRCR